ncbi:MAG TPA: ribose-5-phosphate isomerase RpiA [Caulobacteraceae bacterium]|jgi:ribose 5-phosphate isomerase A
MEAQKRAAGEAAADLIESGMTVGLGTGSTAAWFVRSLAERRPSIACVATSETTAALAASLGLRILDFDLAGEIDLTVDGADEIGPGLALIKGGGGALLREKLVWLASRRCVVIADAGKVAADLGAFPLPIEVTPFGHRRTAERIRIVLHNHGIIAAPIIRVADDAPSRTDGGNLIYDVPCRVIERPVEVATALKDVTGVIDHGLFLGLAERALVAGERGVETIWP